MSNKPTEFVVNQKVKIDDSRYPVLSGTFAINQVNRYEQGRFSWYEGRVEIDGKTIFFSIEGSLNYVSMSEVSNQLTADIEDLKKTGMEPNTIRFGNQTFALEDSGVARFFEDNGKKGKAFDYIEYRSGNQYLTIEDWGDDVFKVWHSVVVKTCEIIS